MIKTKNVFTIASRLPLIFIKQTQLNNLKAKPFSMGLSSKAKFNWNIPTQSNILYSMQNKYSFCYNCKKGPFSINNWVRQQLRQLNNRFGQNHQEAIAELSVRVEENMDSQSQTAVFQLLQLMELAYHYIENYNVTEDQEIRVSIAIKFGELGKIEKALFILEEMLPQVKRVEGEKSEGVANIYLLMARCYSFTANQIFNQTQKNNTFDMIKKSQQIFRQYKNDAKLAQVVHLKGLCYRDKLNDWPASKQCFQQAVQLLENHQLYKMNRVLYGNAHSDYMNCQPITPENASAILKIYEKQLELYRKWMQDPDIDQYQRSQVQYMTYWIRKPIAICQYNLRQFYGAKRNLQISDAYYRKNNMLEQQVVEYLFWCYAELNKLKEGLQYYENSFLYALSIRDIIGDERLVNFAIMYFNDLTRYNEKQKGRDMLTGVKQLILAKEKQEQIPLDLQDTKLILRIDDYLLASYWSSQMYPETFQLIKSLQYRMECHKDSVPKQLIQSIKLNCANLKIRSSIELKYPKEQISKFIELGEKQLIQAKEYLNFQFGKIQLIIGLQKGYVFMNMGDKVGKNIPEIQQLLSTGGFHIFSYLQVVKLIANLYMAKQFTKNNTYRYYLWKIMLVAYKAIQKNKTPILQSPNKSLYFQYFGLYVESKINLLRSHLYMTQFNLREPAYIVIPPVKQFYKQIRNQYETMLAELTPYTQKDQNIKKLIPFMNQTRLTLEALGQSELIGFKK